MTTLTNAMKTCPAIGGTTPSAGAFTSLSCSSLSVSGTTISCTGGSVYFPGTGNTSLGLSVLASISTGSYNTAIGTSALNANATGVSNTAVGYQSMVLATGSYGTAVGDGALGGITSGARNTAFGYRAGYAAGPTALENTFIGASTGLDLGAANIQSCVMVGYAAGSGLTGGNENTFVGTQAGVNPGGSYSNVTVVGKSAEATASNQAVLGNASTTETILRGQVKGGAGTGTGQPILIGTLSVNTNAVGNVGGGTDDLMTYSLPANSLSANGKGVRITAWGSTNNNANAKSLQMYFGSSLILVTLTTSIVGRWKCVAEVFRTGSSTQKFNAVLLECASGSLAAGKQQHQDGTLLETDSGAITIKCTGAATTDNDITQDGMIVEFIS